MKSTPVNLKKAIPHPTVRWSVSEVIRKGENAAWESVHLPQENSNSRSQNRGNRPPREPTPRSKNKTEVIISGRKMRWEVERSQQKTTT
eukprot:scaffold16688_cov143-Skeletonema_marinoi.AAC.3